MASIGSTSSWKSKLDSQPLEDSSATLDIMWSSSQTGCGPLQRLLMDVEPMYQSTQNASSDSIPASGLVRTKATSAPPALFPSRSSTLTTDPKSPKPRPMKRIRSGSYVFAKESVPANDKVSQSQSLELLGKGKLATEMLARVSHSLNEKAISVYSSSQKKPATNQIPGIINEQRTQPPLQSRSNLMLGRCHNIPLKHSTNEQMPGHDRDVESVLKNPHKPIIAKPLMPLKDSPKKGRLKALFQTIDYERTNPTSDFNHRKGQPTRNAPLSQKRLEGSSKEESAGIGQLPGYANQCHSIKPIVLSDTLEISRPPPQQSSNAVQRNAKPVESRRNFISSSVVRSKRSYRTENEVSQAGPMSLRLTDDEDKSGLEPDQSTVGTTVQSLDSFSDDAAYNDANSSSSYGDIDIDASLLEEVCKEYDI